MDNNYKAIYLCSIDKLINSYSLSGLGRGRDLLLLSIINKTLKNLDTLLSRNQKDKLNSLLTIIGNSSKDLCIGDIELTYSYGTDNCMNPNYFNENPDNHRPHIDNPNTIII